MKMIYIYNKVSFLIAAAMLLMLAATSCTYEEGQETYRVKVVLTQPLGDVPVQMTNSLTTSFTAVTDESGTAWLTLPAGIYSANVSKVTEDGYFRNVYNGSVSDIVVGHGNTDITIPVTMTSMQTANPLVIKELYVGGCQKDDGSGIFAIDKCVIIYNNSAAEVSLDNVGIGMVEPYNAEAASHMFLNGGLLAYSEEDWIPAINGVWYFQPGHSIAPYSELVINTCGAIDNTLTYSKSVNYANPDYYCTYDVETTSSDGGKYNNTSYYPSPSEVIPTSHYLKAVKYGKGTAWPMSQTAPAVLLFKTEDMTPQQFAGDNSNIVYPAGKQDNIIYACLKLPRAWVLDAVEVYNANKLADCKKRMTPDLDNGYVSLYNGLGHSLVRKVEKTVDGHVVYQDTNNSTNDFYETDNCSLR
ncbi:MAG: DUF4876 domain-containing protein [Bacteroidales bacterium]|nr:DUF4876 domain-containing protein [Bacteroidales bacterium]MCM1147112.1 DUF4876 domain-containing protein [Bacteroidales bacterium]MCM1205754.1 DUF4876 domain-containing protein [Bacillota bacterium]MCM1511145.1 DUF4876 domain-containing protein [Clostridium sp.]